MKEELPTKEMNPVAYADSCKLFFDFFKHLTTLGTGSIVLLVTFITKGMHDTSNAGLVVNAIVAFIVAIFASVVAMFLFAGHIQARKDLQESNTTMIALAALIAGGSFIAGLVLLASFASTAML